MKVPFTQEQNGTNDMELVQKKKRIFAGVRREAFHLVPKVDGPEK